jgi:rare lipoprotein A
MILDCMLKATSSTRGLRAGNQGNRAQRMAPVNRAIGKRRRLLRFLAGAGLVLVFVHACARQQPPPPPVAGKPKPYRVNGIWYQPIANARDFTQEGLASWYGEEFHGRKTSNGERYNMYEPSAAHKTLPLGTYVRVHNLKNDRSLDVRINDRGPFVHGRIIDLSYAAAKALDIVGPGTAPVRIHALGAPGPSGSGSAGSDQGEPVYVPIDYYSGNFTFQVGAFAERANAVRLVQRLNQVYGNAHMTAYDSGNQIFYRVRVGRTNSLQEAERFEQVLLKNGFPDTFIVAE